MNNKTAALFYLIGGIFVILEFWFMNISSLMRLRNIIGLHDFYFKISGYILEGILVILICVFIFFAGILYEQPKKIK